MGKRFFSWVLVLFSISVIAQTNDPVIMRVNGKDIKKSEFEYFYYKYNSEDVVDKITLDEYIKLFKNLKLRVAAAEEQRLDTTASFVRELADYRSQLAQSYIKDLAIDASIVKKEYDRMKDLVEISHILVVFPNTENTVLKTFPADTVAPYKKAIQLRNRLLKGEDFEKLAAEFSDDTGSKKGERPGYLGWYSGLGLAPSLEDIAFTTPAGKIGTLARSSFGYHIIKVLNKKENTGQVNAAHILIECPADADSIQVEKASKTIYDIYDRLIRGEDFAKVAKTDSNDPGTASQGGDLGWFSPVNMIPEFQKVFNDLKNPGDISIPFKTKFGYHIVKLLDTKPVESFEEKKDEIENKLLSGGYFVALHQQDIDKLKAENGFVKNEAAYKKLTTAANTIYPTDSLFFDVFKQDSEVLFQVGSESFSIAEFILFLEKNTRSAYSVSTELLVDRLEMYEVRAMQEAIDKSLESKYPDFKNLMQEYHDGILMFEISNQEIWEKASLDTVGLENYFEKNRNQFAWDEPYFKGYVVWVKDAKVKKKMLKEIAKMQEDEAVEYLYENYKVGDVSYVSAEKGLFKKGDNAFVDEQAFKSGKAENPVGYQDFFLLGKVINAPESYKDVRGLVVTSYQDYLEEEWQKKLNDQYSIEVNREILNTIK
ncbi:MAG: peptidylprolyl isomerase [Dysgonamonadaceae bacterium]|jgi:peptidyl-prolyl cis-trans isomerase SurA|nr:peptidylprolyl isomerase [Dysgonamonadaceae bacterium]